MYLFYVFFFFSDSKCYEHVRGGSLFTVLIVDVEVLCFIADSVSAFIHLSLATSTKRNLILLVCFHGNLISV